MKLSEQAEQGNHVSMLEMEIDKLSKDIQQNSIDINTKSEEADGVYDTKLISIQEEVKSFTEKLNKLTEEFKERQLKSKCHFKQIS
jgi:tRNA uridine 5-carbamoylmethylation protein Kti12